MVKGEQLECGLGNCGHQWIQRGEEKPLACPRCKRYDWDKSEEDENEE